MSSNLALRQILDAKGYPAGSKVPQEVLIDLIDYVPQLEAATLPPTADELLSGVDYLSGVIKDEGDYSKSIAIVTNEVTAKEGDPIFIKKIVSPPASIGLVQVTINGKKYIFLIFKNKEGLMGFACIGGTLGMMDPNCGPLTQGQRQAAYLTALKRELREEAGLQVIDAMLIDAPQLNARMDHACAFYLVKAELVGEQRLEDSDLSVLVTDLDTAIQALTSYLAIDDFVVKYLRFFQKEIREYFGE
jgi:ADP-ribose pyrophosphatase YjhB (NUDIX family)